MTDRIQKIMAGAGLGSRRQAERWIEEGRVKLNGKRAKLGQSATGRDLIQFDGKTVTIAETLPSDARVLLYHKPEGEICTRAAGEKRPTVFDNLPSLISGRWVSVGRLDLNTSGVLLFTNSGVLANRLMHPSSEIEREYAVRVRGPVKKGAIEVLLKGVAIDGKSAAFDRVEEIQGSEGCNQWFRVVIREGRYREVRKLWEMVGYIVNRLKRIRYGDIKLPRTLRAGKFTSMPPRQRDKVLLMAGMYKSATGDQKPAVSGALKNVKIRSRRAGQYQVGGKLSKQVAKQTKKTVKSRRRN
jgi:23S rRNA pseudouridine2605 synthase